MVYRIVLCVGVILLYCCVCGVCVCVVRVLCVCCECVVSVLCVCCVLIGVLCGECGEWMCGEWMCVVNVDVIL